MRLRIGLRKVWGLLSVCCHNRRLIPNARKNLIVACSELNAVFVI